MHPLFCPLFFFFFVTFFVDVSLCDDDPKYSNCSKRFQCGKNIRGIGYPFWGEGRADYCGHPGFELHCRDDDSGTAEIEIRSMTYQVISISEETKTMNIARKDFMDDPCTTNYVNASLDTNLLRVSPTSTNLTLFYNCNSWPALTNQFSCNDDAGGTTNYYTEIPVPLVRSSCRRVIVTQIFKAAFDRLTIYQSSRVQEGLKGGFDVEYAIDVSQCKDCVDSGGQCGFDSVNQKPICHCFNVTTNGQLRCLPRPPNKGSKKIILIIIVGASAMVAVLIILCILARKFFSNKLMVFSNKRCRSAQNVEAFLMNYGALSPRRYKYSEIKRMTNSFKDMLGQGGYGSVFKGRLLDGRTVAVKLLRESKGNGEEFINEVASISRTSHINIVTLLGFCVEGNKRALIYEFMPNGSLEKFIYDKTRPHLGWKTLYNITAGIARGLEYLHRGCNTRILHFDIKPHNILLDQDFCPKIADFGLSKLCLAKESVLSWTGARGTPGFIAPELISRNFGVVSHKSDVYSYGMMVLEMVGGRKNIDAMAANTSEIYFPQWIYNRLDQSMDFGLQLGVLTSEDEEIVRKMVLVGLWCIQTNPSNRPPANKVLEMLEGNLEELEIPPKPFLSSPSRSQEDFSTVPISSLPRPQEDLSISTLSMS